MFADRVFKPSSENLHCRAFIERDLGACRALSFNRAPKLGRGSHVPEEGELTEMARTRVSHLPAVHRVTFSGWPWLKFVSKGNGPCFCERGFFF